MPSNRARDETQSPCQTPAVRPAPLLVFMFERVRPMRLAHAFNHRSQRRSGDRGAGDRLWPGRLRPESAQARHRARRGDAREADRGDISGGRRRLLSRHGWRPAPDQGSDRRAQHVAGLDWRQRPDVGRAVQGESRIARFPQDGVVASDTALLARHPLELSRTGQRTVFHESDRTGPQSLRAVARRSGCGLLTRSVRQCRQVPRRPDRRPRPDRAGRLLLRRAHRHRRVATVSES